jgi:hypothetical protein
LIELIGYFAPKIVSCLIVLIDYTTKFAKNVGSALINFDDMEVLAQFRSAYSPKLYTVTANLS